MDAKTWESKPPVPLEDGVIDDTQGFIIKEIIDRSVMAPYLRHHIRSKHYPAVVGGVNVVRCAMLSKKARAIIGSLYKNDMDVKYMIKNHVVDNSDPSVQGAARDRAEFVQNMLVDKKVAAILEEAAARTKVPGLRIALEAVDYQQSEWEGLRKSMRMCIKAIYSLGAWQAKRDLIDTGIFSDYSTEMYMNYSLLFDPKISRPVPFYLHKGVPFATCGWTYFDTVRMLILSGQRYHDSLKAVPQVPKDIKFYFGKYLKYLAKFAVLYVQINKLKDNDPNYDAIRDIYNRSQEVMSAINVKTETDSPQVLSPQKRLMKALIKELNGRTNLTRLEMVIKKGMVAKSLRS